MVNAAALVVKLVFDSCAAVFDVSALAVGRVSARCHFHGATYHRAFPLNFR